MDVVCHWILTNVYFYYIIELSFLKLEPFNYDYYNLVMEEALFVCGLVKMKKVLSEKRDIFVRKEAAIHEKREKKEEKFQYFL